MDSKYTVDDIKKLIKDSDSLRSFNNYILTDILNHAYKILIKYMEKDTVDGGSYGKRERVNTFDGRNPDKMGFRFFISVFKEDPFVEIEFRWNNVCFRGDETLVYKSIEGLEYYIKEALNEDGPDPLLPYKLMMDTIKEIFRNNGLVYTELHPA